MRGDKVYLQNILECINKINSYTQGSSRAEFLEKDLIQDAVIRNIEIIGEATKNLSKIIRTDNPEVPWKSMAGMRDKVIHNYLGVDMDLVWDTVKKNLPEVKVLIQDILNNLND